MDHSALHDFDFLAGRWRVHHRQLKQRLSGCEDWIEFRGSTIAQPLMGGCANMDDNTLELPGGAYRAVTLRAFDAFSPDQGLNWETNWIMNFARVS